MAFIFYVFYAVIIGLCVGSFLNVVAYRYPKLMQRNFEDEAREILEQPPVTHEPFNLSTPASHCPSCQKKIRWWMNIPVVSYLALKGQCGFCQQKISFRYPAVELFTGGLTGALAFITPDVTTLLALALALWMTIALMLIDLDTFYLPDSITLPLLWLGLITNSFSLITDLHSAVWGAIVGYMLLWSIYWFYLLVFKKEGMGGGDFKLLAAIGAWLGWQALPTVILLSAGVGALIGITMILLKKQDSDQHIPFGPYLGMAFLIHLFWGEQLNNVMMGV